MKSTSYRAGSNYAELFELGSKKFQSEEDLIKAASAKTGKAQRLVKFDLAVLKSSDHLSNGHRSSYVTNKAGLIKLVACGAATKVKAVKPAKKAVKPAKKIVVTKATVPAIPAVPAPESPATPAAPVVATESVQTTAVPAEVPATSDAK